MGKKNSTTELAAICKVLGDPTRLTVLDLLMQGVQCNCEIGEKLGLEMNLISHHLKILRDAGLVEAERDAADGRWVYYSVNQKTLNLLRTQLLGFLNPARIQPRKPSCGPQIVPVSALRVTRR